MHSGCKVSRSAASGQTPDGRVHFPIFQRLTVAEYGLYPGQQEHPGLHIEFKGGLTLIVGTNGLGKTTLVTMLYRMLAGGYELGRNTLQAEELGGADLAVYRMKPKPRSLFAERVSDRAQNARATLVVRIGDSELSIQRRLDNLGLVAFERDGQALTNDEESFQAEILRLAGLATFGDWLIVLRQMVFYFEDRRSLVWDASAQRQIFRILFLPVHEAESLYVQERKYLELDSNVRNLTFALHRIMKRIAEDEDAQAGSEDVRARIASISPLQEADLRQHADLIERHDELDRQRRALRRDLFQAEDAASRLEDEMDDARLRLVYSRFPDGSATTKYLLSLLLSDGRCAVCSCESPTLASTLADRASTMACVLCGSIDTARSIPEPEPIDQARLQILRDTLDAQRKRISAVESDLRETTSRHRAVSVHLVRLTEAIEDRQQQLDDLMGLLPAGEQKQAEAREELTVLKEKIGDDKRKLDVLANELTSTTQQLNARVLEQADAIKAAFARYAGDFLFETVSLKWSPQMRRIGQLQKFETASFELDMSGTDFPLAQRREGPDAVSESQREFIDLAFRMALIEVAGHGGNGSLVIDAPESSLDAVFVERAAEVLTRFGSPSSASRLIIASNLVDGRLLPQLIRQGVPKSDRDSRLVNLMDIAVPTAAVLRKRSAYEKEWNSILREGGFA
jgi:energy-coupling factor transporter ATP-binding protein EcfA2